MTLPYIIDFVCFAAALAGIAGYVLAFLRNRPYARPFNSLGLLLTGAALLAVPTLIGNGAHVPAGTAVYVVASLAGAVAFQLIAALRRRGPRAGGART